MGLVSGTMVPLVFLWVIVNGDNAANADVEATCRLFQLTKRADRQHPVQYCCSSKLRVSRDAICERCELWSENHPLPLSDTRKRFTLEEHNFMIEIMKQVTDDLAENDDNDTDQVSTAALSMETICASTGTPATTTLFNMEFFRDYLSSVNILNSAVASVNYFSKGSPCSPVPKIDEQVRHNENAAKALLDNMLFHAYRGVPYCAVGFEVRGRDKRQTPHRKSPESADDHSESQRVETAALKSSTQNSPGATIAAYKPGYRAWLASLASITIISMISVAMIVIVGLRRNIKVYRVVLEFFVASAVGALLTDSLLHLYPHSLGLHDHDDHDDHHNHDHHNHDHHNHDHESIYSSSNYLWKGIIIVATIYVFYLIEYLMLIVPKLLGASAHRHHHHHDHHHDHFHQNAADEGNEVADGKQRKKYSTLKNDEIQLPNVDCKIVCNVDDHIAQHRAHSGVPIDCVEHIQEVHGFRPTEARVYGDSQLANEIKPSKHGVTRGTETPLPNEHSWSNESPAVPNENGVVLSGGGFLAELRKVDKVVWMLTFGDALHNFIDGFVIATQFTDDWPKGYLTGIMTSLAILCHEVPHEVGDYAAMLASGLSVRKAVFFNSIATLSCFLGGIIGCSVGSSGHAHWIEPIVAGIFIYVALTVLMPNLIKSLESAKTPLSMFLCHTFGYLCGCTILISLAFHEEALIHH